MTRKRKWVETSGEGWPKQSRIVDDISLTGVSPLANKREIDYDGNHQPSSALVANMTLSTKRFRTSLFFTITGTLALVAGGCSTGSYTGAEPFVHTFRENPDMRDYYVGMNLNFALDQTSSHLPPAHSYDPDVR